MLCTELDKVVEHVGRLAQLARASRLHREGQGFESLSAHEKEIPLTRGYFFV